MTGRWVGLSYDGHHITGTAAITHDPDTARDLVTQTTDSGPT
jgi:hypothetical protein